MNNGKNPKGGINEQGKQHVMPRDKDKQTNKQTNKEAACAEAWIQEAVWHHTTSRVWYAMHQSTQQGIRVDQRCVEFSAQGLYSDIFM